MDIQDNNQNSQQPAQQPEAKQQPVQHQQNQQAQQQTASQQQAAQKSNQYHKPGWKTKLKEFSKECWRVLRVTKKPDKVEFQTIVKVAGIGILVIGFIGFLIHLVKELFL
jgi:protein transport protein SEC61 subunit gamma-like protein